MCGIVGIHSPKLDHIQPRLLVALSAMRHRGPDDAGTWIRQESGIGLGSARLAVMAPENGHQPLRNESGSIRAVVNGEFYDFERLRADLEAQGYRFATGSDSELLVKLYEQHGLECLQYLRGEFAFLLWDETKCRLIAARDRFGIKPLHVVHYDGEWIFASEIKALIAAGIEPRWDECAFLHSLAHQYLQPGESLFAGVRQIKPAHVLVLEDGESREICYWQPSFEPDTSITAGDVQTMLEQAVRLRLRSDVPVACTLSGGLDSSAVAAISGVQDCFCVRFDAPGYDEGPLVLADADEGVRIHEVPVTQRDLVTHLEEAVRQSEGLAINGQLVGKYLLSRAIRDAGFKVVLAGEGADEAFLGYSHLQQDHTQKTAAFAMQRGVMLPLMGETSHYETPIWLERLPTFLQAKLATGRHFASLTRDPFDSQSLVNSTLAAVGQVDGPFVRKSAWLWTRLAMAGYILRTLGDGAEMAHSVEARLPFLDHVLFELAARIPPESLICGEHSKIMLRESLRSVLPENIRTRPKHPFLSPPLECDPMVREFIHDTLHSDDCRSLPLLDHRAVIVWSGKLDSLSKSSRARLDPVLMTLLTATLLQKTYRMT